MSRIADEQFVFAEHPEIPGLRNRCLRDVRNLIFIGEPLAGILMCEQPSQFLFIETDKIEIEVLLLKSGQKIYDGEINIGLAGRGTAGSGNSGRR